MTSPADSETITFGPLHSQWHYHRPSKTFDLSRSPDTHEQKFTLYTTHGPADTKISISPELSALIIVDMQNYFLSPRCRDYPLGLEAVEKLGRPGGVLEKCRELGIQVRIHNQLLRVSKSILTLLKQQVVWLNWGLTDEDKSTMPAGVQRGFSRGLIAGTHKHRGLGADLGDNQGRCLFAGSWNADIYDSLKNQVRPEDVHCAKNRMSGLWNEEQPLWKYLVKAGKKTLLFTGVNTDQCVLGTLTNAYNAGWDCVMIEDCCATPTSGGKEVCIHNIGVSQKHHQASER
jgi:phosphatidylethanolamine-binding protein